MQHGDDRAAQRVVLRQVTPEKPLLRPPTVRRQNLHDHDVRVERAHRLHPHQLEPQRPVRELLDRTKRGVSSNAKVTERARDSIRLPDHAFAFEPFELDFGATRARRRTMKNEIREPESFALQLRLRNDRTTGLLARRRRRKHVGSNGAGESDRRGLARSSPTRLRTPRATSFRSDRLHER